MNGIQLGIRGRSARRGRVAVFAALLGGASCGIEAPPEAGTASASSGIDSFGSSSGQSELDEGGEKLDVADAETTGNAGDCQSGGGENAEAFSIIWIANSPEGTVSKIDTKTGEELARYDAGPREDHEPDPSRTSVNLAGDVAVTDRAGGIAKFAAEESRCSDANGNGTIETSSGPGDVLPFGEDECLLWHIELPNDGDNRHGPRPTAWDAGGEQNPCVVADDRVWVGWWDYEPNVARFRRLDGADGSTLDEVDIPDWDPEQNVNYGPYGGAVDAQGNFWVSGRNPGPLVRIDAETLEVQRWEVPDGTSPYGIAMDASGHPWLAGTSGDVLHFDPDSESFDVIQVESVDRMRGLQVDRDGYAWIAGNNPCGVVQIDTVTLEIIDDAIPLEGCDDPVGVSIDNEGFVWLPDRGADLAFKLDPTDYSIVTTEGLVAPYTYSDMTGAGLGLVVNPPPG